jgi:hypothetical protein
MPSRREGDQVNYLLVASGSAQNVSFLAGWQEFKDYVRNYVKGQPSWTNVLPGQRRGEVEGWTTMKDYEDAVNVYSTATHHSCIQNELTLLPDACCRNRGLMVHLFATATKTSEYKYMTCNCRTHFPDLGSRQHSPSRSGMDTIRINQTLNPGHNSTPTRYTAAAQPTYQYADPYANYYATQPYTVTSTNYSYPAAPVQYVVPPTPAYSQSSAGLPVNLGQGAVLTESRGIFIQSLDYDARSSDVTSLIHSIGLRPIKVKLLKTSAGQSKGCATVEFSKKEDAQYAVSHLHGQRHMRTTLTVRLDKESTIVGAVAPIVREPLVVDGTNRSGVRTSIASTAKMLLLI